MRYEPESEIPLPADDEPELEWSVGEHAHAMNVSEHAIGWSQEPADYNTEKNRSRWDAFESNNTPKHGDPYIVLLSVPEDRTQYVTFDDSADRIVDLIGGEAPENRAVQISAFALAAVMQLAMEAGDTVLIGTWA